MKSPEEGPVEPAGLLRRAGIGVATIELLYLVFWMGRDLGLLESAPFAWSVGGRPGSLTQLVEGMVLAGTVGAVCGLMAALAFRLAYVIIGRRVCRQSGQAFARSLVVRNQTR